MNKTIRKTLAAVALAGGLVLTPAVATAYAPTPNDGAVIAATPGTPVTVSFDPVFTPGEPVTLTLTGINGSTQSLASTGDVSSTSIEKAAAGDGSVTATVTLNDQASGSYTLTATGATSGVSQSVAISVAGGAAGSGTENASLPATGMDSAALGLWVGGGALLLGGGAVLVSRSVRKQKSQA